MKGKLSLFILLLALVSLHFVPAQANVGETFYGVLVTANQNKTVANIYPVYSAFRFDRVFFGLPSMYDISSPTKINIPMDGVWNVGAEITTLGLNYVALGGTPNDRVILNIVKNWCGNESQCPILDHTICAERFEPQNVYAANLNSTSCPVVLEQGDNLQLVIIGRGNLLVESNPYNSGVISPHFYAYYLGATP